MKALLASVTLSAMIAQVQKSTCPAKECRPVLEGILFQCDGRKLRLAATDTHRLAVAAIPTVSEPFEFILQAKDIARVKKILCKRGGVTIEEFDGLFQFTTDTGTIDIQPVSGMFPKIDRVIPTETPYEVTANRTALLQSFAAIVGDRPSINTSEVQLRCTLVFDGGYLLTYNDTQSKTGECEVSSVGPIGEYGCGIAVNGRFMLDALHSIDSDTVRIRLQDNNRLPFLIDGGNPDTGFQLLMPMRMC